MEDRNPHALKSGDRVKVVGVGHRDYGKRGVIVKLEGVADADHGKARAVIAVDSGGFIFVSLPNLKKF